MSFPTIQMKGSGLELTPEITALIEHKLSPLGKFISPRATDTRCEVELEKVAEHQSGKIYRAEINLYTDGTLYRAEGTEDQIEKAIDEMRDNVRHELQKAHEKRESGEKRSGRKLKDLFRFGK